MQHYEHLANYTEQSETGQGASSSGAKSRSQNMVKKSDQVTKIFGCATMWHENIEEMIEMLKSLFRVDMDYRYKVDSYVIYDNCVGEKKCTFL